MQQVPVGQQRDGLAVVVLAVCSGKGLTATLLSYLLPAATHAPFAAALVDGDLDVWTVSSKNPAQW